MACFLVPTAEAVVVTIVRKTMERKGTSPVSPTDTDKKKIFWPRKLHWLTNLLWGGAVLLAYEHLWHGEVVPWFPFLTAAADPQDTAAMLHEMSTVGVSMAVLVTVVWGLLCVVADAMVKRPAVTAKEGASV